MKYKKTFQPFGQKVLGLIAIFEFSIIRHLLIRFIPLFGIGLFRNPQRQPCEQYNDNT